MNHSLNFRSRLIPLLQIAGVTIVCLSFVASKAFAQNSFLEFRYEFDSTEAPLVDSTGQFGNLGLGANGPTHRFGESSLIGGEGYAIGLDAPGDGHPTGTYLVVPNAPQPDSFSFSIWIKPLLTGTSEAIVARDNVWWPSPCAYYCLYIDQFQSLVWKTGGFESILTDEGLIEDNTTYHLVVSYLDSDGPDMGSADRTRIYLNGEMVGEAESPDEIPSLDSIADANNIYAGIWVGTLSSFGGYWGEMDDLQFYNTELSPEQVAAMYANPGTLADFGGGGLTGDFNGNGELDAGDIDELALAVRSMSTDLKYDLNSDTQVTDDDRIFWVKDPNVANSYLGDSNLDGEFNSSDFVYVFTAGKYETEVAAGWGEGDWNGDAKFDSGDFVVAFTDAGYEAGVRPAVTAVPEPSALILIALGGCVMLLRRRSA